MERQMTRLIRGACDLFVETVDASAIAIGEAHQEIAHQSFALLAQIDAIAIPVRAVEHVQQTITSGVYLAIRAVNRRAGCALNYACDRLEGRAARAETP